MSKLNNHYNIEEKFFGRVQELPEEKRFKNKIQIFDEWLYMSSKEKAAHNPFKKMFGDSLMDLPQVNQIIIK
jgi:hypothetical protein